MTGWAPPGAPIIADTGVLYALLDTSDAWHDRVLNWWKANRRTVVVPLAVLPEVTYLLQARIGADAEIAFVRAVSDGEFVTEALDPDDLDRVADVMDQYRDLPLGFVDATLVAMAERFDSRELLTTDRRHFGTVRPRHARGFQLVP